MKLTDHEWHDLLRAVVQAEHHQDCLAKRYGWKDSERAMARAEYSMLFTTLFKQAPSSVRSSMLNNALPGLRRADKSSED